MQWDSSLTPPPAASNLLLSVPHSSITDCWGKRGEEVPFSQVEASCAN